MAVLFVVGGSSAWAQKIAFQPATTTCETVGTLDGTYEVLSNCGRAIFKWEYYALYVKDSSNQVVGSVTADVPSDNPDRVIFTVTNSTATAEGAYTILLPDGYLGYSPSFDDVLGFTLTINLTGMAPAEPVDWTVKTTPANVGGVTDGSVTKTNGQSFSILGDPVQANYSAIDEEGYNKSALQFDADAHTISVVYTKQQVYTYTINVEGTEDENAGVTYNGTLYKAGDHFTTTDLVLTADDFTAASVSQKKGVVTVGTPDASGNVAVTVTYSTEYKYKVTRIDDMGMGAYVIADGTFWGNFGNIYKSTTLYSADDLQATQLAGFTPAITVTESTDPTYDYAIVLIYTNRAYSDSKYDLNVNPASGYAFDDPISSFTLEAPSGCHFDLNQGVGGTDNWKYVPVTIDGKKYYKCRVAAIDNFSNNAVTISLYDEKENIISLKRGAHTLVISEGDLNLLNADGTLTKNNTKEITYTVKYKYIVKYATGSAYPSAKGRVSYDGQNVVLSENWSTGTIYSTKFLTAEDLTGAGVDGYNVEITTIDPGEYEGTIELKYSLIPVHVDVTSQFNKQYEAGTQAQVSYDVLNFGDYTVSRSKTYKDAYFVDESIAVSPSANGGNTVSVSFNPAISGAGDHTLVIPAGMFKYNNNDELLNEEIRITYTLAESYKYVFSFLNETGTRFTEGGVTIGDNEFPSYYHGYSQLFDAQLKESDITVTDVPGYTAALTITQPEGFTAGEIKVVYTLNVTEVAYTNDVTEAVYALTKDALHFQGAVTVLKQPSFNGGNVSGNVTVAADGNDLNITFPANLGVGNYTLTFPNGALKVGDDYSKAFTVSYSVVEKPALVTSIQVNGKTIEGRSVTVEEIKNFILSFDEDFYYYYSMPAGATFTLNGESVSISTYGYNYSYNSNWDYTGHEQYFYVNNTITDPGTYVFSMPAGCVTSVNGHGNEAITLTITIPEPTYFAAMTITPANGAEVESIKTFTLTAPEGVTFDNVKGFQNNGRVTFDDYAYTSTSNVQWAEDNKSVTFNISEETNDGKHTLVIPAGFLRDTEGNWSPELTATYDVVYPWFTLDSWSVSPSTNEEVDAIRGITITAPEGVEFANPASKVTILVNNEETEVAASLKNDAIVLDFNANAANRYDISIPASTFTSTTGKANKTLSLTYTIQPALAISDKARDDDDNYWTTFCLNKPFTLQDGYTPYIVVGKEDSELELKELVGTPVTTTKSAYFAGGYSTGNVVNGNQVKGSEIDGIVKVTFSGPFYESGDYYTVYANGEIMIELLDNSYDVVDVDVRSWSPGAFASYSYTKEKTENGMRITYYDFSYFGGIDIMLGTGEYNKPIIPANTGILVKGTTPASPINYTPASGTTANVDGNLLWGCTQSQLKEVGDDKYIYKLAWANDQYENLGFYWGVDGGHSIQANSGKAYLILDAEQSAGSNRCLIFGGAELPTGIDFVETADDDAPIFNLQGKRVSRENLPAGVYVKNGRKFIVK